ncbi:kinase-like protein [Dentipellis sp. KUC8613]|nr:kinase-like protein [Dentipellis sp. KUC8613]
MTSTIRPESQAQSSESDSPQLPSFRVPSTYDELCELVRTNAVDVIYDSSYTGRTVIRLAPGVIMKCRGDFAEEVRATLYARKRFSFPIPRVLHHPPLKDDPASAAGSSPQEGPASRSPGVWYICTEQCPGVSLDKVIDTMTPAQLQHIASQLRDILAEMDRLRPTTLGSVTGGPYRNEYFPLAILLPHAFSSYSAFLDRLREVLLVFATETYTEDLLSKLPRDAGMRFAHADLYPRNILVDGTTITGIIDWATAGFWPDFWEYVYCAMHRSVTSSPGWERLLGLVFPGERRWDEIDAVTTLVSIIDRFC